ncbi:DUF1501 domain-containing protein [Biformimicrobium ophioploci]|uniref:DUF1501 domain-containing protein n=2 Tax=Biformimicrobium ophioploci TaxID=3036711 RepID=A0ABQ6LUL9_9GAMM|nr:DUF1501 domain-containing protein [Microbulbifer sp. NKW57]
MAGAGVYCFSGRGFAAEAGGSKKKLFWILLRGGMDGIGCLAPVGDPYFEVLRPDIDPDLLLPLESDFALHQNLAGLAGLYRNGELALLPAVATAYRNRSHFDAQKIIENGSADPGLRSGWMNRCLARLEGGALALGQDVPLSLRGEYDAANWAPPIRGGARDDFLERLQRMYGPNGDYADLLRAAITMREQSDDAMSDTRQRRASFAQDCEVAARLALENGSQLVALDFTGWDTHAQQGTVQGKFARQMTQLDQGILALKKTLGKEWRNSLVIVASEFGRTAAYNGTAGTDHGTAGTLIAAGGGLENFGGRVLGDWPGLSGRTLYQQRDIYPANDMNAWLMRLIAPHLNIDPSWMRRVVFPV